MGISIDGDKSYLKYINEMCEEINDLDTLNLKEPLLTIFKKYSGILGFEDMLHLVKCNRYRLVCGSRVCSSMSKDDDSFGPDDLLDIGFNEYLLDSSKQKKMDDNLALLFFSHENIMKAIHAHRYDILIALLPSYLLTNAVLSTKLTREQRIEQLTFGFSLVVTYYHEYIVYDFQNGKQSSSRNGGKNPNMTLFDLSWMKKYLSLTISLCKILIDPRAVHLGALGTHFLEHFFGMIRRFCSGNDSSANFEKAVENIIVYKFIQKEDIPQAEIQPGRSDSGARLPKETCEKKQISVDVCMWKASQLMQKVRSLINQQLNNIICESIGDNPFIHDEDIINFVQFSYADKKKTFNSTSNLRYNSTSGLNSLPRMISGNDI